ncbi:ImmA/IrrE family metallo-endopeptidase [Paenibacillus pinisoli]|uniref:ImmA/IrrE family metallo-endopeptidase n=1 Tax=Paenibacillus pinisoli TaxID=1276110 RepID=A0A3A6PGF6_9BACL|nr:ImmA/IrrE family metallo-endopeptidase [Paenibacillus pinisoli]RJX40912.1 ImmA/IrrE family metallo-endopeptidase [Paenibacillus pinisoli]
MQFDLKLYKPTEVENRISSVYQDSGIVSPADMDLDRIALIFNCHIIYSDKPTMVLYDDDHGGLIFLRANAPREQQREDFFHEISHPALHVGCQDNLPDLFVGLQESQAASFQLYAAMPYYMLADITPCHTFDEYYTLLSETFRLPRIFVQRRIDQVNRRILQGHQDRYIRTRFNNPVSHRFSHTEETLRILRQLNQQLTKKQEALN